MILRFFGYVSVLVDLRHQGVEIVEREFIMRNNKVLTMDEAAIIREADAVSKRIWNKVGPVNVPRLPRPK